MSVLADASGDHNLKSNMVLDLADASGNTCQFWGLWRSPSEILFHLGLDLCESGL